MARRATRVCVVGPGTRFLSGITYYTLSLCNALGGVCDASAILMRQLLPTALYPGRKRVGAVLTRITLSPRIAHYDGVDWFWVPSLARAIQFLSRQRPDAIIMQWWTGTVLHSYLAIALAGRLLGARIVIEFHEVLDTGEDRLPVARSYVGLAAPLLFRLASGYVVHTIYDRDLVRERYDLPADKIAIIPHATYGHYKQGHVRREAPPDCCNLLCFGIIRPFKGVEDLIHAFEAMPVDEVEHYWLTIVGETWEGWTLPSDLIKRSPYKDRITYVNRYVHDDEVDGYFGGADVVVLPYHRSSQSGPLHIAFYYGLPTVVTSVGGLIEAAANYEGAVLAEPANPESLLTAIRSAAILRGQRFADPRGWDASASSYMEFLARLDHRTIEGVVQS